MICDLEKSSGIIVIYEQLGQYHHSQANCNGSTPVVSPWVFIQLLMNHNLKKQALCILLQEAVQMDKLFSLAF